MENLPHPDLDDTRLYANRELSLLEFFARVLAMAGQRSTPLLERLRYLTITSTILDEFFEVRVAGHKQRILLGISRRDASGLTPQETLQKISVRAREIIDEQYRLLNDEVLPGLTAAGPQLGRRTQWTEDQRTWVSEYFDEQVAPVLTPVGLDPAHPFPKLLNKSLNMLVTLEGKDAFGRISEFAVLPVPRCLPRVIPMPPNIASDSDAFVLLSSVIHSNIGQVFPGMKVTGCHQFRVTRNADLTVEEEEVEDLLDALKGQLHHRRFGDAVRLEVAANCPESYVQFLLDQFDLTEDDLYRVDGPVNLHRLEALYKQIDRPELKFPVFVPSVQPGTAGDIFEILSQRDILLHQPFESFGPVVDFIRQAAADPDVLAIKQTMYRSSSDSPIVEALVEAARAGKEVTVVVELRARFDEAANIGFATRLQEAGAHVVYGVVGYKTHAKMFLVVRREANKLRRYCHLGTGNYHTGTARAYTDFSLMTSSKAFTRDVHQLFMQLTGLGRAKKLRKLLQSPFTLQPRLIAMIDDEIAEAKAGRPARVTIKVNSVSDPAMIQALYRASMAGVKVQLIVRGVCCLRPGIEGISENVVVRSVVGRFLEHSRIYNFHAAGRELIYLSSADLMGRNLYRRVEAGFPIEDPVLKRRVLEEGLGLYVSDNCMAWEMGSDGRYIAVLPAGDELPRSAQASLLTLHE